MFPTLNRYIRTTPAHICLAASLCAALASTEARSAEVGLRVEFIPGAGRHRAPSVPPSSVAWLVPMDAADPPEPASLPRTYRMVQRNKRFDPHLLVVPVGSLVEFPNEDPFFHNVFSLYNGKRFDLGLYETGSQRGVRFDREGVSYIFCNIHPEMGAVILAVSTPYYAISRDGSIAISGVPPGKYMLNVWSEDATAQSLSSARKQVTVAAEGANFGTVSLVAAPSPIQHHANKFGESYPKGAGSDSTGPPY
jgi:plastocyanin